MHFDYKAHRHQDGHDQSKVILLNMRNLSKRNITVTTHSANKVMRYNLTKLAMYLTKTNKIAGDFC